MSTIACFSHTQLYASFSIASSFHNATLAINEELRQRIENYGYICTIYHSSISIFLDPWSKRYEDAVFAHDDKLSHSVREELRRFSKEIKQPA